VTPDEIAVVLALSPQVRALLLLACWKDGLPCYTGWRASSESLWTHEAGAGQVRNSVAWVSVSAPETGPSISDAERVYAVPVDTGEILKVVTTRLWLHGVHRPGARVCLIDRGPGDRWSAETIDGEDEVAGATARLVALRLLACG
jgi:hypothetical protein